MAKRKSSERVATYRIRYRYIGPAGDTRYSSMVVEADDEEDAGLVVVERLKKRGLRHCVITAVGLFNPDQMTLPGT